MNILVIGGTRFLGRQFVDEARAAGDTVTIFHRGATNPGLFDGVEEVLGDRDGGLAPLKGRTFDTVIDTCGYVPRVVRQSAELLAEATEHYVFVSTVSVYADLDRVPLTEETRIGTLDDPTIEEITGESYGPLKALCEDVVSDVFGARALVIRPGLIVGPHDPSDRFTYWPARIARGGDVLAPGGGTTNVQFIDARDLAAWILRAARRRLSGTFNATGPQEPFTLREVLTACVDELNPDARLEWVDESFLLDRDVAPWMELPLWIPEGVSPGLGHTDVSRAVAEGLTSRPLAEIVRDTYAWDVSRHPEDDADRAEERRWGNAGLDPQKEAELLTAWRVAGEKGSTVIE